ncbi:MAG TPA: AlpA family phage regulatory protein [Candidatus Saccharimonadales bacterium]|nr:AlpA family phage regulatory protein [Candidatus Saccharimonadales bacterium]
MDQLHKIVLRSKLVQYSGLGRTQTDKLIAEGRFPRPVKLSARRIGWLEQELIAWQQDRLAERDRVRVTSDTGKGSHEA